MNRDRQIWDVWAASLHKWGLGDFTASFLDAVGPLTIVGAQVVYILQPFWGRHSSRASMAQLARMLEKPEEVHAFIEFLREDPR